MTTDKDILRAKLNEYYTTIFEAELINEIIDNGILRTIDSHELLIDIGDKMTHIPLILSGAVKIIREDDNGDEIALYFLEKGDTCAISFVNCIHKTKSMFRGITEKETESIFIPVNKIDYWLVKYESWRHFIIDSYHMRLIEMVQSIDSLAFMKLDDRLLKYLNDKVKIMKNNILKITHQEIADDLNTSRVVVSRLLKILENEGKIKIKRNRIIVDNI
ncbi:Crp/Fnr family transcriptional regulator [Lutibacter sp. A64]|uniref:Crp/Fnr family transcriptional regulator n=1 Tax=Lutibacter sp. A64 TaxID=2918526 RepID=UPI001F06E4E4|nr:Crp/Fnr family transcriptional regulator [Lutibacter sp. A64]UMB53894.1 Crp/Fnr family transcriptional regulator [Lutibacter sp. A64]